MNDRATAAPTRALGTANPAFHSGPAARVPPAPVVSGRSRPQAPVVSGCRRPPGRSRPPAAVAPGRSGPRPQSPPGRSGPRPQWPPAAVAPRPQSPQAAMVPGRSGPRPQSPGRSRPQATPKWHYWHCRQHLSPQLPVESRPTIAQARPPCHLAQPHFRRNLFCDTRMTLFRPRVTLIRSRVTLLSRRVTPPVTPQPPDSLSW
jgi:hypothetical protein